VNTDTDVTLADVARRAGVSLATASRVLNGSARRVGERLTESVRVAARELDYVPNLNAQALARSRTEIAGIIVHDVGDAYFSEILRGIERVANASGQLMLVCNAERDPERELSYVRLLHAQRARTMILTGSGRDDPAYNARLAEVLRAFTSRGGRVVAIGRHALGVDMVRPDNYAGGAELGRYLADLGHRRVGVVTGPAWLTSVSDRLAGFCAGFVGEPVVVVGSFDRSSGRDAAEHFARIAPDLTAIACFNDEMALGVLASLRERGIRVPHDVSVSGFGDVPVSSDVTPALTTVAIPMSAMGERAMELALAPAALEPRDEILSLVLRPRDSTAAAATS
jgi:LacI family transcriptional regulator